VLTLSAIFPPVKEIPRVLAQAVLSIEVIDPGGGSGPTPGIDRSAHP